MPQPNALARVRGNVANKSGSEVEGGGEGQGVRSREAEQDEGEEKEEGQKQHRWCALELA